MCASMGRLNSALITAIRSTKLDSTNLSITSFVGRRPSLVASFVLPVNSFGLSDEEREGLVGLAKNRKPPPQAGGNGELPELRRLIGYRRELGVVKEGLTSPYPVVCIKGLAGTGKTHLATQIGYDCDETKAFESVIWISAKDEPHENYGWRSYSPQWPGSTAKRTTASRRLQSHREKDSSWCTNSSRTTRHLSSWTITTPSMMRISIVGSRECRRQARCCSPAVTLPRDCRECRASCGPPSN